MTEQRSLQVKRRLKGKKINQVAHKNYQNHLVEKKNTNEVITNAGLAKIKPTWEDSNSKGSAIFYKMGYRGGGLGKDGSGIEKPIGVRVRPDGLGLGYGDFKEQTADTLIDFDGSLKDKIMDDELIDELNKKDQNNKDIEEELD